LSPELKTLDEEKDKRDVDGIRLSCTKVIEWPRDLRGGKDSP